MAERRESGLLSQLGRAQQKISTLEEFLRDRERQARADFYTPQGFVWPN